MTDINGIGLLEVSRNEDVEFILMSELKLTNGSSEVDTHIGGIVSSINLREGRSGTLNHSSRPPQVDSTFLRLPKFLSLSSLYFITASKWYLSMSPGIIIFQIYNYTILLCLPRSKYFKNAIKYYYSLSSEIIIFQDCN